MSNNKPIDFINSLPEYAEQYIINCLSNKKEVATGSGKIVEVNDRHIPTIAYFLNIWLPLLQLETINRKTYYEWMNGEDELKSNTIKKIDENFKALAADIVANEGKGIFYAKNKLGWSDKIDSTTKTSVSILNIDPLDDSTDHITKENS